MELELECNTVRTFVLCGLPDGQICAREMHQKNASSWVCRSNCRAEEVLEAVGTAAHKILLSFGHTHPEGAKPSADIYFNTTTSSSVCICALASVWQSHTQQDIVTGCPSTQTWPKLPETVWVSWERISCSLIDTRRMLAGEAPLMSSNKYGLALHPSNNSSSLPFELCFFPPSSVLKWLQRQQTATLTHRPSAAHSSRILKPEVFSRLRQRATKSAPLP